MTNRFIESHIRQIPRFARMPEGPFSLVAQGFQVLRFEPGERVFRQGEPARGLYLFVTGRGRLLQADEHGQETTIGVINQNQYLNENALYNPTLETASLEATETATVLHLARQTLLDIVTHHPEVKTWLPVTAGDVSNPERTHTRLFQAQRDNERILMDTRRHWWVWVRRNWISTILLMVLLVLSSQLPAALSVAVDGLSLILAGLWTIYTYLEWRNDHVIITNQRVIRIERNIPRFETHVSELPLSAVQAVNADIITGDPFSRVFGYGTVDVRTAGDAGNLKLTVMPDPDAVQELIFVNRNAALAQREHQQQSQIRAEIDKVLGIHNPEANVSANAVAKQKQPDMPQSFLERGTLWPTAFVDDKGNSVFRKHVAFLFRRMMLPLLLVLASPVLVILSFTVFDQYSAAGLLAAFVFLVFGVIWIYWVDWDWRHDRYVVTDERIQIIHQRPLWLQNEDDIALLQSVDNVVSKKRGITQNLFDYGDVIISLIGGDQGDQKVFRSVPRPQQVQAEITRRQNRMRAKRAEQQEDQRREEIAEYLQAYHETVAGQQYPGQAYAPAGGTPQPLPSQQAAHYPDADEYPQAPQRRPPPVQPPVTDNQPRPPSRRTGGTRPPNIPRRRGE